MATQNHQKPLRSHSVVISKAGPSRAIFLNAARTENFHSRSLASSVKHFHFYVTFGSVKRTGRRWQPTQVDFEPSAVELGATVRHVCRCDTNVTRSLRQRENMELRLDGHTEKLLSQRNVVRARDTLTFWSPVTLMFMFERR